MGLHVRADTIEGLQVDVFIASLLEYTGATRYLIAKETPQGNPHIHCYLDTVRSTNDVRNWITRKFPVLKKHDKCVKKWGDDPVDMEYYCKGTGKGTGICIMKTSFSPFEIAQWNKDYWDRPKSNYGTLTESLVAECRAKGVKSQEGVVEVFCNMRIGREGICPFKHGPTIRSAWLALNCEEDRRSMYVMMAMKIFSEYNV